MDNDIEKFIKFLVSRGMTEDYARSQTSFLLRQNNGAIKRVMELVEVITEWSNS